MFRKNIKTKVTSNILFLVPGFPEDENDTTCIPPLQLYAQYFNENCDCSLTIISFQYPYRKGKYLWNKIPVYSAGGKGQGKIYRLLTWLRVIIFFVKINRKEKISGIHSFWMDECALVGNLLSKLFRIPHIVTLMGQDVKPSNKYLKHISLKNLTIISTSEFASEIFNKTSFHKAYEIIPFGIDENHFPNGFELREIDIIGVGSQIPLKNYKLFVEIVDVLRKDFKNLKAVLVGNGFQRAEIEDLVKKKNLNEQIEFKGHLPRIEVLKLMSKSKIFLHTSEFESQGYVFLEALKCGLNIVSFNVGFLPSSKKIHICSNKSEMIDEIKMLLNTELDHSIEIPFTMKETVKKYRSVYKDSGMLSLN